MNQTKIVLEAIKGIVGSTLAPYLLPSQYSCEAFWYELVDKVRIHISLDHVTKSNLDVTGMASDLQSRCRALLELGEATESRTMVDICTFEDMLYDHYGDGDEWPDSILMEDLLEDLGQPYMTIHFIFLYSAG